MSAFLAYKYSVCLTFAEGEQIDRKVLENRKSDYLFIKSIPGKVKIVIICTFFFMVQPAAPAEAMLMPVPTSICKIDSLEKKRTKTTLGFRTAPVITPKVDKVLLRNNQIKKLDIVSSQFKNDSVSITEIIERLRGGDGLTDLAAVISLSAALRMFELISGVGGFQIQPTPLPSMDPFGWFSGKYTTKLNPQSMFYPPSRFQRDAIHLFKLMCTVSHNEKGFVMNYDEAFKLIQEHYPWALPITGNFKVSAWQTLKHMYHGIGFGIKPEDFNTTQKELSLISNGLINYIREGHPLPTSDHVISVANAIKDLCFNSTTRQIDDSKYYDINGVTPATVFINNITKQIIVFNQTSGDFITGGKRKQKVLDEFLKKNYLGSKKYFEKWSK